MCVICLVLGRKIRVIQTHFVYLNIHFGRLNVAFQMTVFEYCVLIVCWIALLLHNNLWPPATLSVKKKIAGKTKGHLMHQCRHQRQVQQSPLVLSGMVVESLRTSEQNGKSSTHPGRQLRGNCCILQNFKRLLVPDCPGNELLPSSHIMSGGKEFTWGDAVSTVRPLAAGVSDRSRTKAQCLRWCGAPAISKQANTLLLG